MIIRKLIPNGTKLNLSIEPPGMNNKIFSKDGKLCGMVGKFIKDNQNLNLLDVRILKVYLFNF